MTNRAGTLVSNLSGEMAYESFRPALLPPNPPIEVSGEFPCMSVKSPSFLTD